MFMMKRMMFIENKSKLNFEETVNAVSESATKHGWHVPRIDDLQKTYKEAGHEDMTKVKVVEICKPHGAYKILKDDKNKKMAAMMPIKIAVYETNDGQVYVSGMRIGFMGKLFGGVIKEVMSEGAEDMEKTLESVIEK